MAPYTTVTFAQLQQQLAQRLNDPTSTFWVKEELIFALQDAFRLWNILTGDNRTQFALSLSPATTWYDLQTLSGSPRLSTLTDYDIYTRMQLLLIEGATPLTLLTTQFTAADFSTAVQLKRDEFLLRTSCTRTITTLPITPSTPNISLPQTTIDAPRAYWLPTAPDGVPFPLPKSDSFTQTAYQPNAFSDTAPAPNTFSSGIEETLNITLYPQPLNPGSVEFITVQSQAILPDPAPAPTILYIPSDFAPAIMWGALGYLLSISTEAQDKPRADYCNSRFDQFIEMMSAYPFVMTARVAGQPLYVDAVENLDAYSPGWRVAGVVPSIIGSAGANLLAIPSATAQTITLFMLANANVPVNDSDPIQLGREIQDALLDYAQHTLSFVMGGAEFAATLPLMQSIIALAATRNSRIKSLSIYRDAMYGTAQRQAKEEVDA